MFKDKSKIVFFSDMDGTLLSTDKKLSEENASAIARLRDAGGMFTPATGRVIQATRHYFKPFGLDCPTILCNGGMIYDCGTNSVKWSEYLPVQKALSMVEELLKRFPEACAEICTPDDIYDVNINDQEKHHWKIGGFTAKICGSLDEVPKENWCKILFAMPSESTAPFAECALGLDYASDVEYVKSSEIFYEMLPKNCTKGYALNKFKELYGLTDCVTVAIGDFYNDLEMLKAADFSACPSNAPDDVKAVCDFVCTVDNDHGAVAQVIDHILK